MGANDPALALHTSGVPMRLNGSDRGGPLLARYAADFTPLLMPQYFVPLRSKKKRPAADVAPLPVPVVE